MQLLSKVKAECETTTSKPRDPWPYTVSSPRSHGIRMALETTKFELFIGRASTAKNIYIYIYISEGPHEPRRQDVLTKYDFIFDFDLILFIYIYI
jgi:hypothetical protein